MTTFTALTTVDGKEAAYAVSEAMERMDPEPLGVGVFELEDGSGLWEIGGYFTEKPDLAALMLCPLPLVLANLRYQKCPRLIGSQR